MLNALDAAKAGIREFDRNSPHDFYWEQISPKIEGLVLKATKEFKRECTFGVNKDMRSVVAARLWNLGYKVDYDPIGTGPIKISWGHMNCKAGNEIFQEEHVCECRHCKKEMKHG